MTSSFPGGIDQFPTHHNITDPVDANDINRLQAAIVAVQTALGAAFTQLHSVEVLTNTALTNATSAQNAAAIASALSQGASSTAQNALTTANNDQNQINRITHYDNLAEYLLALAEGLQVHAATSVTSNLPCAMTGQGKWARLNLAKPSVAEDPLAMWNGNGFTLKKSGYFDIHVGMDVVFNQNNGFNLNVGTFEGAVYRNGTRIPNAIDHGSAQYVNGHWVPVRLNPSIKGWFNAGDNISLWYSQNSGAAQTFASTVLSIHRIRG